ncbi:MAG TPA: hypothetical protein VGR37_07570 [Longimicrobiaceae bacterium]|nr:hypothetical protein [Longimicrobiaceae bacterium]
MRSAVYAALGSIALLSGCGAYWYSPMPAPQRSPSTPAQVRVTQRDSTRVVLAQAVLYRDSLAGVVARGPGKRERVAVAVADIAYVQYRQPGYLPREGWTGVAAVFGTVGILYFLVPKLLPLD